MNPLREATPDSEALVSSEDERPWPTAPSFGSLPPRKENGMPGMAGGSIWASKRGSFKMEKAAQRNAAREARLGAIPPSGLRTGSSPSPAASDATGVLPFAIPLQPPPKAGRSMSHSQGQRETPSVFGQQSRTDHSTLGLVAEEIDTDSEPELGNSLTQTTSHPPIGSLQRMSTYPNRYDDSLAISTEGSMNPIEYGIRAQASTAGDRRFSSTAANFPSEQSIRPQWQSRLGWDDVAPVNESRRHSLADIPTRRGSLVGNEGRSTFSSGLAYQVEQHARTTAEEIEQPFASGKGVTGLTKHDSVFQQQPQQHQQQQRDPWQIQNMEDKREEPRIPDMYKAPIIQLSAEERGEQDQRLQGVAPSSLSGPQWAAGNRPRKMLYIVIFKASRPDVFYLLDNTGLDINPGDIVIVEADRGQDLGTVQHANVSPDEARVLKRKYSEEQYKWLMMFSQHNSSGNVNPNAPTFDQGTAQGVTRENMTSLKPKAIKRLASPHEINMLSEKEGNEAKAKRTCQQKVALLRLDMEILDAEWQWDFQKLTFYYYADHYINFKDLVTELYRIYKTRIWLSAINPASFSPNTLGQPPSGIGPGAITAHQQSAMNQSYAMSYGQDPDPYGAVPPYQIGYPTYTPNYPGIPGMPNSFPPQATTGATSQGLEQTYAAAGQGADTTGPGAGPTAPSFQPYASQRNEHASAGIQRQNWGAPGLANSVGRDAGIGMMHPQRSDAPPGWYGNMSTTVSTRPMSSDFAAQDPHFHHANLRARPMTSAAGGPRLYRNGMPNAGMSLFAPGQPFRAGTVSPDATQGQIAEMNRQSANSPLRQRFNNFNPGNVDNNRGGASIQFGSHAGVANDAPGALADLQNHFRNLDVNQEENMRADDMSRER